MLPDVGALYRDHGASVWRYTRTRLPTDADAEDVTSEVFARAMRSTHTFDPTRGTPRAWLIGIARHATADWWRRRPPGEPMSAVPEDPSDDDPATGVLRAEGVDEVRRLLGVLTEREREAVGLRFGTEPSSAEIGAALGVSPTAARMLVYRAVGKLRAVWPDD